jgi:hypothetical protein
MDNTYISNRDINPQEIALAALAGAGAIEGGRFAKQGYYGVDASDFVKNPVYWSRMFMNPDSIIARNPMLKGSVIASEDITRNKLVPNRALVQPQNAVLSDLLSDFKYNEEWMDPATGQITRASDYGDTSFIPKIKDESLIAKKGGIVPAQPFRDAINFIEGNTLKFLNNKGLPFGNKIRNISVEDMPMAIDDMYDTAVNNYNDVSIAKIIKERKSKGNRFDSAANKDMFDKLRKLSNYRPEIVSDLLGLQARTNLPLDDIISAYSQLSGGTNHMGAMSSLEEAIDLYQTVGFLPEYELTQAERVLDELPQNKRIQYAAGMLDRNNDFGTPKNLPQGTKTNLLVGILRDLAGLPNGEDRFVLDTQDIKKALNVGEYRTKTIPNYFFESPKAYNKLLGSIEKGVLDSPAFNFLSKAGGKKLSGIQTILRGLR